MKRACKNFNNKHEKSTCEFSSIIGKCFHIGRKIINLATIITLLSFNNISAQQKNIDSLQNKLELASINEKPVILNDISEEYFNNNNAEMAEKYSSDAIISSRKTSNIYEEARGYKNRSAALLLQSRYNEAVESAEKSINYFLKINKSKEAAETYNLIGQIYKQRLDYSKSMTSYKKAINLFGFAGDSLGLASTYNLMGSLMLRQANYSEALKYYQLSLDVRKRSKDSLSIAGSYSNIALVYRDQGDFPKALEMAFQAQQIYISLKNKSQLANIYNLMGSIYFRKNDYKNAIDYYEKALALRKELDNKKEIAASYVNIGNVYKEINNFSKAFEYLNNALELRQQIGDNKLIALSENALGSAYWKAKKYNEALTHYLKSLKIALESNNKTEIASAYYNIGNIYLELNNYEKALKHFSEALIESSSIDDPIKVASIYQSMGNAYQKSDKFKEALESYNKALDIRQLLGDQAQIAITLSSIADVYSNMNDFSHALNYYKKSLDIRKKLGDKVTISTTLNAIGNLYLAANQRVQALDYFNQALKYAQDAGYLFNVGLCMRKIGEIYVDFKQFDKALPMFEKSIEIGKQINNYELLRRGYYGLYTYYNAIKQYKQALDNYILYSNYSDSINVSMTNKQLLDMQLNFEMASQQSQVKRQETEIALLKKEKQYNEMQVVKNRLIIVILIVIVLLVLSLVILYYNRYQLKHKAAVALKEKLDIIEKINQQLKESEEELRKLNNTKDKFFSIMAHDIKNPLGGMLTITDVIKNDFKRLTDEEKMEMFETINKSAQHLYTLLENLLHWSRSQTGRIPFKPVKLNLYEIVNNNIELQKANSDKKNIIIINMIDQNLTAVADKEMFNLIVRNLISNAIKFTNNNGQIIISAQQKDGMIEVSVEDNGVGISKDNIGKLFRIDTQLIVPGTNNETGTGLGLILCKEFVTKNGGDIWVTSEEGKGTKFSFTVPAN